MDPFIFIAATYFVAAIYLGYALGTQVERRKNEQERCGHRWEYRSLDNLDHYWQRVCLDCSHYEKLEKEDVPYDERCKAKNFPPLS